MNAETLEPRVRAICLALPEATEKRSHGAPADHIAALDAGPG